MYYEEDTPSNKDDWYYKKIREFDGIYFEETFKYYKKPNKKDLRFLIEGIDPIEIIEIEKLFCKCSENDKDEKYYVGEDGCPYYKRVYYNENERPIFSDSDSGSENERPIFSDSD